MSLIIDTCMKGAICPRPISFDIDLTFFCIYFRIIFDEDAAVKSRPALVTRSANESAVRSRLSDLYRVRRPSEQVAF
jgi:hypothetical protein